MIGCWLLVIDMKTDWILLSVLKINLLRMHCLKLTPFLICDVILLNRGVMHIAYHSCGFNCSYISKMLSGKGSTWIKKSWKGYSSQEIYGVLYNYCSFLDRKSVSEKSVSADQNLIKPEIGIGQEFCNRSISIIHPNACSPEYS